MTKAHYRPKEAAEYLGVSIPTIWRYIRDGKLKAKKLSHRVTTISLTELETFAG
jgi:excisionase family DNA binding protein